jgi:hypothetical protein
VLSTTGWRGCASCVSDVVRGSTANLIAALLTVAALLALAGYQVTSDTSAKRMLGRVGAAVIELDRWLPAHEDDIEFLSRERPNAPLELPDLPINIAIPAAAAIDSDRQTLRAAITEAMGERLYTEGARAVHDDVGETHLDFAEPVRWSINLLSESAHGFWTLLLIITGLFLLALCGSMVWTRQSPMLPIAIGGGFAAACSALAWMVASLLGTLMSGTIDQELALVLRDGAWIGLRNGLAVLALGLGATFLLNTLFPRREHQWHEQDDWAEYEGT